MMRIFLIFSAIFTILTGILFVTCGGVVILGNLSNFTNGTSQQGEILVMTLPFILFGIFLVIKGIKLISNGKNTDNTSTKNMIMYKIGMIFLILGLFGLLTFVLGTFSIRNYPIMKLVSSFLLHVAMIIGGNILVVKSGMGGPWNDYIYKYMGLKKDTVRTNELPPKI